MRSDYLVLTLGVLLVAAGTFTAYRVQTGAGSIAVDRVHFTGRNGNALSALRYVPSSATVAHPAPAVLAVHGYINSSETQSGFAIEFARRGYVVLALDQTGHGLSAPPAFGNDFGGPDGLAYLRELDGVDADNIGLEGHSMGGWAVLAAARANPAGYRSMVLEGSATGSFGAPEGTPDFPRNLAVVFSRYDEFSELMWDVPTGAAVRDSAKLQRVFGTGTAIVPGRIYGDVDAGTARVLDTPAVTHPGDHISRAAIGAAINWFALTLNGGTPKPAADQVWHWKEFGTLLALCGMIAAVIGCGLILVRSVLQPAPIPPITVTAPRPWLRATLTAVIPVLTYFPLFKAADTFWQPSALWPQQLSNGLVLWALTNALLALAMMRIIGHGTSSATRSSVWRVGDGAGDLLRAGFIAVVSVAFGYLLLWVVDALFVVDFRFWVVAFKRLATWHAAPFVTYLVPMTGFFIVLGASIREFALIGSTFSACLRCIAILISGFVLLLVIQYVALLLGHPLPLGEPLLTILAIQFVVLLTIAAITATVFARATHGIYVGAFINALLVTWSVVAGQATRFAV